jgi:ribosomal protein S12 methylthiotransferase
VRARRYDDGVAGRFHLVTLGCPKNAVDSDKIAAALGADGCDATDDVGAADLVVVNTCAFIEDARRESIDTVLALADARRPGARLVVTGCLAERYGDELADALPEVDAVVGFDGAGAIGAYADLDAAPTTSVAFLGRRGAGPSPQGVRDLLELPRAAPSAPWAYLKVAEGCDRACAFCAIPSFRGKQRSRTSDSIVREARDLVAGGAVELVLVAQDLAWYGRDAGEPGALAPLLRRLDAELAPEGLARVRLLYLYPSEVKDPLVSTMLELPTVVPYFDLSLQHAARGLLKRMARWGSGDKFLAAIDRIRAHEPDATFRSSFIVGFPGETETDHDALLTFLDDAQLDWAGFFPFSEEAGTPAATLDGRVAVDLMAERLRECGALQTEITQAARDALVLAGAPLEVLVDAVHGDGVVGRTHREAPEIDGVVHLEYEAGSPSDWDRPAPGDLVEARTTGALGPDLYARAVHPVRGAR